MKIRLLLSLFAGLFCCNTWGQTTADAWISQGRSDLAARDIGDASTAFAQAVALEPTNETANAFYAITRLLVLPSLPAGSNFLTRLSLPVAGRDIYNWTSAPPKDINGLFLAPTGVNADEFVAQMRTNALPVIVAAIGNLSAVNNTNFTLNLTSSDTAIADVTVDYGDFKLIQAALYGAEYSIYTLNGQNLSAELTDLRALYTNGMLSFGQVLTDYPQLFTFSTTNDLQSARAAFTNGVITYMVASDFIRLRPTNEVRLFNFDQQSAQGEGDFRLTLQDLFNSLLVGPQFLALYPDLAVDMSPQFDGSLNLRGLLPKFDGNAIELGSLPDLTCGGMIYGLTTEMAESCLGNRFTMLPVGSAPELSAGNKVNLAFTTLNEHNYVLEASTNLADWQVVAEFTAGGAVSSLVDSQPPGLNRRFYRLRDDTGVMAFTGEVLAENTGLPIAGALIYSVWDGTTTFADASGQFYLKTTLPTSWGADELTVSASGYSANDSVYYGNGLVSGLQIYLAPPPPNDDFINRTVLAGSNVTTNGDNFGATWENGEPYDGDQYFYSGKTKSVWFTWTAPSTGPYAFSVSASTVQQPILAIYTGTDLSSLTGIMNVSGYNYHANLAIDAVAGQAYQIEVDDVQNIGGPYTLSIAP
jgi:hypothetical protein